MRDPEALAAVCCLVGANSAMTVEELQFISGLAQRLGIEMGPLRADTAKIRDDEEFRQQQIDLALRDAEGVMGELIREARAAGMLEDGHATMALWRVATDQLQMSPERFQSLLSGGAAGT